LNFGKIKYNFTENKTGTGERKKCVQNNKPWAP